MTHPLAHKTGDAIADLLADPATAPLGPDASLHRQHLAYGPIGIALLHIERAAAGMGPWQRAHDWLAAAAGQPFTAGPDSHPFYGAPALAHAVACAAEYQPGPYQKALASLDARIITETRRRLNDAHRRIEAGRLPGYAEFDTIRGLAGYGAYLLRRDPDSSTLAAVLDYCVRLVAPVSVDGESLPGWWTMSGPSGRPDEHFPGGHANHGMAHGIGGVLALLALAARRGTVVTGQLDAMRTILAWMDRWREPAGHGIVWPYWVTRADLRAGRVARTVPRRPSWCYGTAGLARARQLAALALRDHPLQIESEYAVFAALVDPPQLKATTDSSLCHGFAGLAHLVSRIAADADPAMRFQLRTVVPSLLASVLPRGIDPTVAAKEAVHAQAGPGFLDGAAGMALALLSPATRTPPSSAWDSCLLIA